MTDIKQIIADCKKFDKKAQKMLYNKYASLMLGICMRYAKDKQEAEDILQEGFLKVFSKIEQYNKDKSFDAWIRRIMINTSITNYRKNLKRYYQEEIEDYKNYKYLPDNNADFTKDELLNAIRSLPRGYQMVFNLYAIEGYKHKEIAKMLDITETTSKSQYHRARILLQTKLAEMTKEKI